MQNEPWEPCPRCGSNHVKVEPAGERRGNGIQNALNVIGVIAYSAWAISMAPPSGDGSGFVAALLILLGCIFVFPLLSVITSIVSLVFSFSGKGYVATCQDCSFQWNMAEAEQESSAPTSQPH